MHIVYVAFSHISHITVQETIFTIFMCADDGVNNFHIDPRFLKTLNLFSTFAAGACFSHMSQHSCQHSFRGWAKFRNCLISHKYKVDNKEDANPFIQHTINLSLSVSQGMWSWIGCSWHGWLLCILDLNESSFKTIKLQKKQFDETNVCCFPEARIQFCDVMCCNFAVKCPRFYMLNVCFFMLPFYDQYEYR